MIVVEPLLTTRDVADILKLSDTNTVLRFIRSKRLHATWVGCKWLVSQTALRDFLDLAPTMADGNRITRLRLAHV